MDQPTSLPRLAQLITPMSAAQFFSIHWEKAFCHISRHVPGYYDSLLSLPDLDGYFQRQDLHPAFVKVLTSGISSAPEHWTTPQQRRQTEPYRVIAVERLLALFNAGSTIVINAAETAFPAVTALCSALGNELTARVQANVYLTPPHTRGTLPHYDTHDVLVLQLSGHKHWCLYDIPEMLPLHEQPVCVEAYAARTPTYQCELRPGDVLYLPRGLVHDAITTTTTSVHVTLGIHADLWFHLLEEIVTLAQNDPVFHQSLPHRLSSKADKSRFTETFTQRLHTLITHVDLAALLDRRAAAFVRHHLVDGRARFMDVLQVAHLSLDSVVSRRAHLAYRVEHRAHHLVITFAQQSLTVPRFMAPALALLWQEQPFAVRDLAGLLSDAGKVALVKRFVQAGFLTMASLSASGSAPCVS